MGRSVLLIIGGGIAAYKALELIRELGRRGIGVRVILTKAGAQFVTGLSAAALSGNKVHDDLFSLTDETEMGHIELSRAADLVVVAPATADLMAKLAGGLANDLASTTLLATDKKVLMAPAMNVRMWTHAATQRNLNQLKMDGVHFVGPNEGDMACGEFGPGRMAEPVEIAAAIDALLAPQPKSLTGKHVLITAGPTREAIDPVRYLSNHSSGKQGYAIAEAAVALGAQVTLVSGPVNLTVPPGVGMMPVTSADEMMKAVQSSLPADIAIFSAAVADWKVADVATGKIKKSADGKVPSLAFTENPDIVQSVGQMKKGRPRLVVGFAAETENTIQNATAKLAKKACDVIVANDVSPDQGVFGGDVNTVHIVTSKGVENWPRLSKQDVARRLMDMLAQMV
jgi:phosphopantothenoylcysteine decarboxylase / phosphopantothenate---cysteine ligase